MFSPPGTVNPAAEDDGEPFVSSNLAARCGRRPSSNQLQDFEGGRESSAIDDLKPEDDFQPEDDLQPDDDEVLMDLDAPVRSTSPDESTARDCLSKLDIRYNSRQPWPTSALSPKLFRQCNGTSAAGKLGDTRRPTGRSCTAEDQSHVQPQPAATCSSRRRARVF